MSEAEAHLILEAARDAIHNVQQSAGIEEIPLRRGRAFVKAVRTPDPDHPSRMANGFVIISLSDEEVEELIHAAVQGILDRVPALELEGDPDAAGWKRLDLGRPVSPPRNERISSKPLRKLLLIAPMIAVAVAVAGVWFAFRSDGSTPSDDDNRSPSRSSQPDEATDPEEPRWARTRSQIQDLLEERWAKRLLGEESTIQPTNRDLLTQFSRLFHPPDIEKITRGQISSDKLRKFSVHPFAAFLSRFPEEPTSPDAGSRDLTATEAIRYLESLRDKLKKQGFEFDLDDSATLVDQVKSCLNYGDFFHRWQINSIQDVRAIHPVGQWDQDGENREGYGWVREIREMIKFRYYRSDFQETP